MSGELIFVSIASYRDAQLVPTVRDCLAKARWPERLRFGLCWQHGADENALPFADDRRFQILDVPWRESRGACWARAAIMKLWRGERWFLQIDSHCRFAAGWDELLIAMAGETGSPKPLLSTYPPSFTPAAEGREWLGGDPLQMAAQGFTAEGIPFMRPLGIPDWQARRRPLRARFLAAGFLFAPGTLVHEVPYDPELYFLGEEATMTLRAFTHGYDLFHPHRNAVWHDYVRADATRHWDDHTEEPARPGWSALDTISKARIAQLLASELHGPFGLGTARSLADYEAYAGLSLRLRKLQNDTLRSVEPPNAPAHEGWANEILPWMVRVLVDTATLPAGALVDPAFWCVIVYDEERAEIFRRDFPREELLTLAGDEATIALICEFESGISPAEWSVQPVSRTLGWLHRIDGVLADDDFAVMADEEA